jgi:hypothetical protein
MTTAAFILYDHSTSVETCAHIEQWRTCEWRVSCLWARYTHRAVPSRPALRPVTAQACYKTTWPTSLASVDCGSGVPDDARFQHLIMPVPPQSCQMAQDKEFISECMCNLHVQSWSSTYLLLLVQATMIMKHALSTVDAHSQPWTMDTAEIFLAMYK